MQWRSFDPKKVIFPTWLVEGLIPESSVCCVYGAPNTGKSFLVLDMALAIAKGLSWLDLGTRNSVGQAKERGKVVYILAEGPEGLNRRIAAWCQHQQLDWELTAQELSDSFFIPLIENIYLDDPDGLKHVIDQIKAHCPDVALIILDPLVSFMSGDENSARDMQALIQATRKMVEEFRSSRCSVLLVHHAGKDESKAERGSSALRGGVETLLELKEWGLRVLKQRDAGKLPLIPIELLTIAQAAEDGKTRDLGKVVIKKIKSPAPPPRKTPENTTTDGDGISRAADAPAAEKAGEPEPARKKGVVLKREEKNRDVIIATMTKLAGDDPEAVISVANIQKMAKKFEGNKSTFYDFVGKLAEPQGDKPALLVKVAKGKYRLAPQAAPPQDAVYSSEVPSQSDPSQPADEAGIDVGFP